MFDGSAEKMSGGTMTPWSIPWSQLTREMLGYWLCVVGELVVISMVAMVMTSQRLMGEKSLFCTSVKFLIEVVHKYVVYVMVPIVLKDDWMVDVDLTFSCAVFYKGMVLLPSSNSPRIYRCARVKVS